MSFLCALSWQKQFHLLNIQIARARQQLTLSHFMIKSFHLQLEAPFSCNFELNLNAENVSSIVSQKLVSRT